MVRLFVKCGCGVRHSVREERITCACGNHIWVIYEAGEVYPLSDLKPATIEKGE
jgi:hypothetical protein